MRGVAIGLIIAGAILAMVGVFFRVAAIEGQQEAAIGWASTPADSGAAAPSKAEQTITRLEFPEQHASYFIRDGANRKSLLLGPARVAWSAAPGSDGNCVIIAHRDTHFRMLKDVRKEDPIIVERGNERYEYRIVSLQITSANDTRMYRATREPTLTLVTCYPFFYLGRAPKRFVVRARLTGQPL